MQVTATELGFYNGRRYRAGATFELKAGDKPGSWMKPVTEPKADKPKADKPKADKAEAK